jgi:hypothetical protein
MSASYLLELSWYLFPSYIPEFVQSCSNTTDRELLSIEEGLVGHLGQMSYVLVARSFSLIYYEELTSY